MSKNIYVGMSLKELKIAKYYVNAGGASPYDSIAFNCGWKLGINSGNKYNPTSKVEMIDNDFINYDHARHLNLVKAFCPELATAKDIESSEEIVKVLNQAEELKLYCQKLILIPKINCLKEINVFAKNIETDILLGYPVGRFEIAERRNYCFYSNYKVHLLGGSFKRLFKLINEYKDCIFSLDSNYSSRIAGYGKICLTTGDKIPYQSQVPSGENFNYRCFEYSLKSFEKAIQQPQLCFW